VDSWELNARPAITGDLPEHHERHLILATDPTFPIETIRGQYALRFDEMLDILLAAVKRHPHPTAPLSDATLRRRLHGILDGTIAFAISSGPEHQMLTELGEALFGMCDGTRQALADIRLTLFDLLTDSLAGVYPPLRLAIDTALVHVSYGWMLRDTKRDRPQTGPIVAPLQEEWTERLYHEAAARVPRGFFVIEATSGELVMFNQAMTDLFGFTLEEELQLSPEDYRIEDSPEDDFDLVADMLAGKVTHFQRVGARPHKDGHPVWFQVLAWPIPNDDGEIVYIANLVTPVDGAGTTGQGGSQSDTRIRYLSRLSSDPIFIIGPDGDIRYASPSVERVLGYDPESLTGTRFDQLVLEEDRAANCGMVEQVLKAPRKSGKVEVRLTRIDGEAPWFELVASNLVDVEDVGGVTLQGRDISERKALETQLEGLASIDSLTGLFNRRGFLNALDTMLATRNPDMEAVRLVYIDLDNFKEINDQHGHLAGDDILVQIADRLRRVVGEHGVVGRIGGDEFVAMLHDEDMLVLDRLESELEQALDLCCDFEGVDVMVRGTMGVAEAADGGVLPRELLQLADNALYERKAARIRGGATAGLKAR
jgi:diguanylate cyclase (GGDEF)-like protein/PAS domain S-box-containing protein